MANHTAQASMLIRRPVDEVFDAFDWCDGNSVDIGFEALGSDTARVAVEVTGFENESDVVNATEGFAIVLCDLKTLLESGRSANLVRDKAELIASS